MLSISISSALLSFPLYCLPVIKFSFFHDVSTYQKISRLFLSLTIHSLSMRPSSIARFYNAENDTVSTKMAKQKDDTGYFGYILPLRRSSIGRTTHRYAQAERANSLSLGFKRKGRSSENRFLRCEQCAIVASPLFLLFLLRVKPKRNFLLPPSLLCKDRKLFFSPTLLRAVNYMVGIPLAEGTRERFALLLLDPSWRKIKPTRTHTDTHVHICICKHISPCELSIVQAHDCIEYHGNVCRKTGGRAYHQVYLRSLLNGFPPPPSSLPVDICYQGVLMVMSAMGCFFRPFCIHSYSVIRKSCMSFL